jgi:hypothetical protein
MFSRGRLFRPLSGYIMATTIARQPQDLAGVTK